VKLFLPEEQNLEGFLLQILSTALHGISKSQYSLIIDVILFVGMKSRMKILSLGHALTKF